MRSWSGAAQWLYAARQRDFYGLGGSAQVARDAACKFLRIGLRGSAFDDGLMMLMSASLLQKGDVAVAFSYTGQTLIVLEAVRQARKNGAHVIAITNSPGSRLTQVAHVVLCATVEDSPLTGENGAARVAQLNLLDALFMAVARSNPTATEANLSRTMSVVRTQRAYWGCKPKPPKIPSSWVSGFCYLMEPPLVDVGIQRNVT